MRLTEAPDKAKVLDGGRKIMELTRFIDANSFKTQPFVPSEEESDRANARALEAGISGIADVANMSNLHD